MNRKIRVDVSISEFADLHSELTQEEVQEIMEGILLKEITGVIREEVREAIQEFRGQVAGAIKPRMDDRFQKAVDHVEDMDDSAFMWAGLQLGED